MKTSANLQSQQNQEVNVKGKSLSYKLIAVLFVILFNVSSIFSQDVVSGKTFLDLGIDYFASGNGHGAFYAPTIILNRNYNGIAIAPMIYKNTKELSGLKVSYIRNLTGKIKDDFQEVGLSKEDSLNLIEYKNFKNNHKDILEINFYSYVQYNGMLPLSPANASFEQLANAEKDVNWSQARVSTGEAGVGFQLHYNINNNINFCVYSGFSAYHHFAYEHELYNGRDAVSLNLGVTLAYTIDVFNHSSKKR